MITDAEILAADTAYFTTRGELHARWTAALEAAYAARRVPSEDDLAELLAAHPGASFHDMAKLIKKEFGYVG
jgi:hypothetical protein